MKDTLQQMWATVKHRINGTSSIHHKLEKSWDTHERMTFKGIKIVPQINMLADRYSIIPSILPHGFAVPFYSKYYKQHYILTTTIQCLSIFQFIILYQAYLSIPFMGDDEFENLSLLDYYKLDKQLLEIFDHSILYTYFTSNINKLKSINQNKSFDIEVLIKLTITNFTYRRNALTTSENSTMDAINILGIGKK